MTMDAKARKRIYPELRIKQTHLFPRILGMLFVLIGLGLVVGNIVLAVKENDLARLLYALVGLLFSYVGLLATGLDLWEWLRALLHRRTWQGVQLAADGEIVDRAVKRRVDDEGSVSHTYWITVRFDTTEGPVVLKTQVEQRQYARLRGAETVVVRYALDNPRLALLEGEWEDQ
jgi:hypothetical protein